MARPDLRPAARTMAAVLDGVPDDRLGAPTPCAAYTLGDLLDHVARLTVAFTVAATKGTPATAGRRSGDAARLGDDWRTRIPRDLEALVLAWQDPGAWTGTTRAGGLELPGEMAGLVALNELVIHGWDVARATSQPYPWDPETVEVAHGFVSRFAEGGGSGDLFGPAVEVPDGAPLLDRVVGLSGRDPAWAAP